MGTDSVVLAQGVTMAQGLPNDNVVVVGCSGTGKSLSVEYPTLFGLEKSSIIANFAKPYEAFSMARSFKKRGYRTLICDLEEPARGNISFDPLQYLASYSDVAELANQIVHSSLEKAKDDYWNAKSKPLLEMLICASLMTQENASWTDVLDLFDELQIEEHGSQISTALDGFFNRIHRFNPHCLAAREYNSLKNLPIKTAGCCRDNLAACLSAIFPEEIRLGMHEKPHIDFERLASERTALFIIGSTNSTQLFANLLYDTAIRVLLKYAQRCPGGKVPVPVKLVFDDFACSAPIQAFPKMISVFRAAGISAMLLLQSESQLRGIYGEEHAMTILNNCSCYVYFPGGMDLTTCRHVAERMDTALDQVLYAPPGKVFVMMSGHRPMVKPRYPIFEDQRYLDMIRPPGGRDKNA